MQTNHNTNLKEQAKNLREEGKRLATFQRGENEEVRVSLDEFKGYRFLSIRLWSKDSQGRWLPSKKGITVKTREVEQFSQAVSEALTEVQSQAGGGNDR